MASDSLTAAPTIIIIFNIKLLYDNIHIMRGHIHGTVSLPATRGPSMPVHRGASAYVKRKEYPGPLRRTPGGGFKTLHFGLEIPGASTLKKSGQGRLSAPRAHDFTSFTARESTDGVALGGNFHTGRSAGKQTS